MTLAGYPGGRNRSRMLVGRADRDRVRGSWDAAGEGGEPVLSRSAAEVDSPMPRTARSCEPLTSVTL